MKRIGLGYETDQSAWVAVDFDTRPDAEPDGKWTLYFWGNHMERPHWLEANEAVRDAPLALVLPDGTEKVIPVKGTWTDRYSLLVTAIGEMLRAVLLQARAGGLFAGLPKTAGCELWVEHFNGAYGWPVYELRGEENLADQYASEDRPRD